MWSVDPLDTRFVPRSHSIIPLLTYLTHKALLFPLQFLGYSVDYINTVSLSNHPGHRSFFINPASNPGYNDITSNIDTLGKSITRLFTHLLTHSLTRCIRYARLQHGMFRLQ